MTIGTLGTYLTFNSTLFTNGTAVNPANVTFTYGALKAKTNPNFNFTLGPQEADANLTWIQNTFIGVQMDNITTGHQSQLFFKFPPGVTGGVPANTRFDQAGSNTTIGSGSYCNSAPSVCFNTVPAVYYNSAKGYLETNETQTTRSGLSIFFLFTITSVSFSIQLSSAHGVTNGTFTVSGNTGGPSSVVSDGISHHGYTASSGAIITVTAPVDGANTRFRFGTGLSTWTFLAANSTMSNTVYYQLQNTYTITGYPNSVAFDNVTIIPTGTILGAGSATVCTFNPAPFNTQSCQSWTDYNKVVTFPNQATNDPLYIQWNATGTKTFTSTTGGNYYNISYYRLITQNFAYSIVGSSSGASAPTLSYMQFGGLLTYTETGSLTPKYLDYGITWNLTNPLTGSTASKRWDANANTSGLALVLNGNYTTKYYAQWNFTISYSVSVGSPSAPTLTAHQFGASYTPTITLSPTTYWLDNNTAWSLTNPLSPGPTQRWYTYATTSGNALAQTTLAPNYLEQWLLVITIDPIGGGSVNATSGFRNNSATFKLTATPSGSHSFTNFTGIGTGSYSGTSNPSGTITMSAYITETVFFSGAGSSGTVIVLLNPGNPAQPPLNPNTNRFAVNWTLGGGGFSGGMYNTVNVVVADIGSQVGINTVSGVNPTPSLNRTCFNACVNLYITVLSGTHTYSYFTYGQANLSVAFVKPTGSPYTGNQVPKFIFTQFGSVVNTPLATSYQTIWADNGTTWTSTNPFPFDLNYYTPHPLTELTNNSATFSITYTQGGAPTTNDALQGFLQGQYVLGFVLSYGNTISVGWFIAILMLAFDAFIYLKSGNAGLTLSILFIGFALFSTAALGVGGTATTFLTTSVWQIALIFGVLFMSGTVYKLVTGRQG